MLYEVKQEGGYGVRLRGVRELSFDVATKRLDVVLPFGKFGVNGVVSITAADDSAPWLNCIEFFGGSGSGGMASAFDTVSQINDDGREKRVEDVDGYEFPRESEVPPELAATTFAPLARYTPYPQMFGRAVRYKRNSDALKKALANRGRFSSRDGKFSIDADKGVIDYAENGAVPYAIPSEIPLGHLV